MSNYPPGVTGNEFEISGPDHEWEAPPDRPCDACDWEPGDPLDGDALYSASKADEVIWQQHHSRGLWWFCPNCDDVVEVDLPEEELGPDPDDLRDEKLDREWDDDAETRHE